MASVYYVIQEYTSNFIGLNFVIMTSYLGHDFRVAGLLWGKTTGDRWILSQRARNAEPWCLVLLNNQSTSWWLETPWGSCAVTLICWSNQQLQPHDSTHSHDDVIKWKHFPRYWPFVRGIHRSPVNSPHKGQWRGALMFPLICVWINGWVNNREAGDLRRHGAHYDVIVMWLAHLSPDVLEASDVILCHQIPNIWFKGVQKGHRNDSSLFLPPFLSRKV